MVVGCKHTIEIRPAARAVIVKEAAGFCVWGPGGVRKIATAAEGMLLLGGGRVAVQVDRFVLVEHTLDRAVLHLGAGVRKSETIVRRTLNPVDRVRVLASSPLGGVGAVVARMVPCTEADLLDAGVAALDEILDDLGGGARVEKAEKPLDPNDQRDMAKIVRELTAGINDPAERVERAALIRELRDMREIDWQDLTPDERVELLGSAAVVVGGAVVASGAAATIGTTATAAGAAVVQATRKSVSASLKIPLRTSLNLMDQRIVAGVKAQAGHYLTDRGGNLRDRLTREGQRVVEAALADGLGSAEIARRLEGEWLSDQTFGRNRSYAELCAQAWTQDARSYSQIASYQEAGITRYQILAVMDEATTTICQELDGKEFDVGTSMRQFEQRSAWTDPREIKSAAPWVRAAGGALFIKPPGGDRVEIGSRDEEGVFRFAMSDNALQGSGVGYPPFHGYCRTTTVPVI